MTGVIRHVETAEGHLVEIEAYARHVEVAIADSKLEKISIVATAAAKIMADQAEHELALLPLSPDDATLFCSMMMRACATWPTIGQHWWRR